MPHSRNDLTSKLSSVEALSFEDLQGVCSYALEHYLDHLRVDNYPL